MIFQDTSIITSWISNIFGFTVWADTLSDVIFPMVQLLYLISNTMSLICILLKLMIFADTLKDIILTLGQCDPYFMAQRFFVVFIKLLHGLALDLSHTNGLTL